MLDIISVWLLLHFLHLFLCNCLIFESAIPAHRPFKDVMGNTAVLQLHFLRGCYWTVKLWYCYCFWQAFWQPLWFAIILMAAFFHFFSTVSLKPFRCHFPPLPELNHVLHWPEYLVHKMKPDNPFSTKYTEAQLVCQHQFTLIKEKWMAHWQLITSLSGFEDNFHQPMFPCDISLAWGLPI